MKVLIRSALVLGIVLAIPMTSYAVGAEAAKPAERTMHHHKGDLAKATALAAPRGAAVAPSSPLPETDGLSRNDDECNYGCIDH